MLPPKLLAATCTVVLTTIDDAVWLVPHVASPRLSRLVRFLHGAVFLATLTALAVLSWGLAGLAEMVAYQWMFSRKNSGDVERTVGRLLSLLGAGLCWLIAIVMFLRKLLKQRRRQPPFQGGGAEGESQGLIYQKSKKESHRHPLYGGGSNVPQQQSEASEHSSDQGAFSPWTVMALTTLGALDELSYFPTLIMGHILSPLELCAGTLLAACVVLLIVTCCLAHFQPLVDCFDRIPLYSVVTLFAMLLTAKAIAERQ